jgi:hypothetical protein
VHVALPARLLCCSARLALRVGRPSYAFDLNEAIFERVIQDPRRFKPDGLSRNPRKPELHLVHPKVTLGIGVNRIEIYPIRGETSERQMMVYFPEHHLLYGSDPFQQLPDGTYFYPQTVTELQDAVAREHLLVERFFMMHIGPTPWSELDKAVQATEKENTPTGVL